VEWIENYTQQKIKLLHNYLKITFMNKSVKFILTSLLISSMVLCSCGRERTGAVCNDGSTSRATGSGACSHHDGVQYWTYK